MTGLVLFEKFTDSQKKDHKFSCLSNVMVI